MATQSNTLGTSKVTVKYKASLVRRAKVNGEWKRGALALDKKGNPKPDHMKVSGSEVHCPEGVYQLRTYDAQGKAAYETLGNDLNQAIDYFERILHARAEDRINARHGVKKIERAEDIKTLAQLVADYINEKKSPSLELSETTIRHYEDTLPAFAKIANRQYVTDVTEGDVEAYMNDLTRQEYSKKTKKMRYGVVRGFLYNNGVNISKLISKPNHKRWSPKIDRETNPYSQSDLDRLLGVCDEYYRTLFLFLLNTGVRRDEASHLVWANVNFENNTIFIPGEQTINRRVYTRKSGKMDVIKVEFATKNRTGRTVPLFASLKPVLLEWRKQNPDTIFVFGTRRDLPDNHWIEKGKELWHKAGLDCGVCESCVSVVKRWGAGCENFFLHRFRHSYAHRLLDGGKSIYKVSKWMGHSSVEITMIYLSGSIDASAEAEDDPFTPKAAPQAHAPVIHLVKAAAA